VGNMLIIRHGNYYSVYSKLARVYVNQGDQVRTNQHIGDIEEVLHFELWEEKTKQNPSHWIK